MSSDLLKSMVRLTICRRIIKNFAEKSESEFESQIGQIFFPRAEILTLYMKMKIIPTFIRDDENYKVHLIYNIAWKIILIGFIPKFSLLRTFRSDKINQ